MTALGQRASGGMSIGSVLDLLRPEFPDVTISKIRFLESEGLVSPERTAAGYRRFSVADCERLRYVLTAQRDRYLPLRVIKEQLDRMDCVGRDVPTAERGPRLLAVAPDAPDGTIVFERACARIVRFTGADLIARAEITEDFLNRLVSAGLITPGAAGYFDEAAVTIAETAKTLCDHGLEVRHLRMFKLAAEREADLVAQLAGPVAMGRDADARERAHELMSELTALSVTLHTQLLHTAVHDIPTHG